MKVVSPQQMEARRGPAEWFTGEVWMEPVSVPRPGATFVRVFFAPGARTNWHTHPEGQYLYVVTGTCYAAQEGEPPTEVQAGRLVYFEPGERHWHGAAPDTFMIHIAINPALESDGGTEWLQPVSDEDYRRE